MFHAKTSSAHTMDGVLKKTSSAHRRSVTVACSSAYPLRPELENAQTEGTRGGATVVSSNFSVSLTHQMMKRSTTKSSIDLASLRRLGVSCNRVRPRDRPPRGCEGVKQRRRGRVCAARRAGAFSKDSAETPFRLCLQTL